MSANPYDRRRDPRTLREYPALISHTFSGRGETEHREPVLTTVELEAMIYSAQRRAVRAADARAAEREQDARRVAWEEGHSEGVSAGSAALLDRIDQRVGHLARDRHEAGRALLAKVGERSRDVTKGDLERELDAAVDVLATLISEHHNGFVELPF